MNFLIHIKPLSVNQCWKGVRYKTPAYNRYEKAVLLMLPKGEINTVERVYIEFGVSSKLMDIDNGIKPILDILQKKYGFNDRDIYELHIKKTIVQKGNEFISINFVSL